MNLDAAIPPAGPSAVSYPSERITCNQFANAAPDLPHHADLLRPSTRPPPNIPAAPAAGPLLPTSWLISAQSAVIRSATPEPKRTATNRTRTLRRTSPADPSSLPGTGTGGTFSSGKSKKTLGTLMSPTAVSAANP